MRKACAFVTAIAKLPLIVKDCAGFLVNRVLAPYMMEAVRLYQQGEPREKIDQAALKFGMPMGPLELMDMVGLDIANKVGEQLYLAPGTDNVLSTLVKQGKLGKKTGEGFYVWEEGKPKREEVTYDQAELERLGRALVKPMLDEADRALADQRGGERRSCRCRRDLRHGLRAVPRRSAALSPDTRPSGLGKSCGIRATGAARIIMAETSMRRVAVLGGSRIPFCRSHTAYAELSNLDMLTAALGGLVDRFALHGTHIDEVVGGAVVTHAKDWNLAREAVIGSALAPTTPGITMMQACGTSLAGALGIAAKIATGQIELGISLGSDTTSDAPIVFQRRIAQRLVQLVARAEPRPEGRGLQGLHSRRACAAAALDLRAAHRAQHGRALRTDGQGMGHHPRGAGSAGL